MFNCTNNSVSLLEEVQSCKKTHWHLRLRDNLHIQEQVMCPAPFPLHSRQQQLSCPANCLSGNCLCDPQSKHEARVPAHQPTLLWSMEMIEFQPSKSLKWKGEVISQKKSYYLSFLTEAYYKASDKLLFFLFQCNFCCLSFTAVSIFLFFHKLATAYIFIFAKILFTENLHSI